MESNLESQVSHLNNRIEDIRLLGDKNITPLLNEFNHYLLNLKKSIQDFENIQKFDFISSYLSQSLADKVKVFLLNSHNVDDVNFYGNEIQSSFQSWDKILDVFPCVIESLNSIPIKASSIDIEVKESQVGVYLFVNNFDELLNFRDKAYELTLKLFQKKCFLTFEVKKQNNQDCFILYFRFKSNENLVSIKYSHFSIPGIMKSYQISKSDFRRMPFHTILEITDSFTIKRYDQQLILNLDGSFGEADIYHLSFLFRPITLIIPNRGQVLPADMSNQIEITGSENAYPEIDIFKIFSSSDF